MRAAKEVWFETEYLPDLPPCLRECMTYPETVIGEGDMDALQIALHLSHQRQEIITALEQAWSGAPGLGKRTAITFTDYLLHEVASRSLPGDVLQHDPEKILKFSQADCTVWNRLMSKMTKHYPTGTSLPHRRPLTRKQLRLIRQWWLESGGGQG
jgi:hypothetical protein